MNNKNLKKLMIGIGIAAVLIVIVLIVSILISKNTKLTLTQEHPLEETVKDTTAPKAELKERVIFTNDITKLEDFSSVIESVSDASDYTAKLIRFEKEDVLSVLNDLELKNLLEKISTPDVEDELTALGTTDVPTDAGIYRSVLEIADEHGNASYEEIFVVLDTTGASISDVEDLVVYVDDEDKLAEEPELDLSNYKGADNVDGTLTGEEFTITLSERDEEKHEWITRVSYTDRAGNESVGEFLITVKLKKEETSTGGTNQADAGSGTTDAGTGGGAASTPVAPSTPVQTPSVYDPADTNMDGVVDGEESCAYIDADEQACLNAGYGVVVAFNNGEYYMVLTHADGMVNGVDGMDILSNYLAQFGLKALHYGSSSNYANDWVWYRAYDIYTPLTPEDEGFWH